MSNKVTTCLKKWVESSLWKEIYVPLFHKKRERKLEINKKNIKNGFEHERNERGKIYVFFVRV